jgi:hypothetical protein
LKARLGLTLLRRRLGFRALLEAIPLDASLVRGSHGRPPESAGGSPLFVTQRADLLDEPVVGPTDICELLLRHLEPAAVTSFPAVVGQQGALANDSGRTPG